MILKPGQTIPNETAIMAQFLDLLGHCGARGYLSSVIAQGKTSDSFYHCGPFTASLQARKCTPLLLSEYGLIQRTYDRLRVESKALVWQLLPGFFSFWFMALLQPQSLVDTSWVSPSRIMVHANPLVLQRVRVVLIDRISRNWGGTFLL